MFRTLLVAVALAAPAVAQSSVPSIVGPPLAPIGCPIDMTFTNHTMALLITNLCPYQVFDEFGALVHTPTCFAIAVIVAPGGTFTTTWEQVDDLGAQVPPGKYRIDFTVPEIGIVQHMVEIAPVDGGISMLGVLEVGETRSAKICAPAFPNATYLMAAAGSATGGIPTCNGTIPLDFDLIMQLSLNGSSSVFLNFFGTLDASGMSNAPEVAVPDLAALQGLGLIFDFVVLDLFQPCPVLAISEPLPLTIQ